MTVIGHSVSFNRVFLDRRHCVGEDSDAVARYVRTDLKNPVVACQVVFSHCFRGFGSTNGIADATLLHAVAVYLINAWVNF